MLKLVIEVRREQVDFSSYEDHLPVEFLLDTMINVLVSAPKVWVSIYSARDCYRIVR